MNLVIDMDFLFFSGSNLIWGTTNLPTILILKLATHHLAVVLIMYS